MLQKVLSNLVITGFRLASTMYNAQGTKTKRTDRHCWAVVLKYEGETEYYNNGNTFVSNINNAVILPSGCKYDWICTHSGHYCILEFDAVITYDAILPVPIKDGEKLFKMIKEIEYKQTAGTPMKNAELIRDTYSILIHLVRLEQPSYAAAQKYGRIAPAVEYIVKNYSKGVTNDELAGLVGMSTVYFRKLFRELKGESPIAFAHRLKIEKAVEMLKSDYGTIGEIAISLGYQNIYDFSRDFKKHIGISPTKYKKIQATS